MCHSTHNNYSQILIRRTRLSGSFAYIEQMSASRQLSMIKYTNYRRIFQTRIYRNFGYSKCGRRSLSFRPAPSISCITQRLYHGYTII